MDDSQHTHTIVNNVHSADEWESWRVVLHKLYIEEERSLAEVQQHMKENYGFVAEGHQYKLRFKKWDFKKSYTAQEKQAWAQGLANGTVSQDTLAHNKPLKLDRIVRHVRTQMRAASKITATHNSSPVAAVSPNQQTAIITPVDSTFLWTPPTEDSFSHGALPACASSSTDVYASIRYPQHWFPMLPDETCLHLLALETAKHDVKYSLRSYFWTLMEVKLLDGLRLMVQNHAEDAHHSFDWACEEAAAHLQANPASFMISIVLTLSPVWTLYPMTHHRLYSSFLEMSLSGLGAQHPVTKFLEFAMNLNLVHDIFHSARRYAETILSSTFVSEVPDLQSRVFVFSPDRLIQEQNVSAIRQSEAVGHIESTEDMSQEPVRDLNTDFDKVIEKLAIGSGLDPWTHFTPGFFTMSGVCRYEKPSYTMTGGVCPLAERTGNECLKSLSGRLDLPDELLFTGQIVSHESESRRWTVAYNRIPHLLQTQWHRSRRRKTRPVPVRSTRYMVYHR